MASRRLHLTRTTVAVLLAVACWLALGTVLLRLTQRPAARAWIARYLAARLTLALRQPVTIGDARVTLVPPRLTLRAVELGAPGRVVGRADAVEVGLSQVRLAEREIVLSQLRLRGVRISGAVEGGGGGGGTREPWVGVVVRQLAVEDLAVEHLDLPGGIAVEASDVQLRWAGSGRRPMTAVVAQAGRLEVRAPGVEPVAAAFSAWGRRTDTGWEVRRLRATGGWWEADLRGDLAAGVASAAGMLRADLAELDRTLHIGAGLAGEASARVTATATAGELRVDAEVTLPRARVATFELTDAEGEVHLTQDGVEASLARATFAGGVVEGSYVLAALGAPWPHRVAARGEGVSAAGFLQALGVDPAGLAAGLRFTADVGWEGTRIKEGSGTGVVQLAARPGEVPVAGQVVVSLARDGALAIASERATIAGAPLRWEGRLAIGSWVPSWSVQVDRIAVATVARLLRGWVGEDVLPSPLVGETSLDLRLRGPFTDLAVVGDVAVAPVSFGPIAADGLEGLLRVAGGKVNFEGGEVLVGPGRVACEGSLDFAHDNELALTLRGRDVPLERLAAWGGVPAPVRGRVDFTGRVWGPLAAPGAEAELRLRGVSLAGAPFGDGDGRIDVASGVVVLRDLEVGPFSAGVEVDLVARAARIDARLASFGLEAISPPLARLVGGALDCSFHGEFPFDSPSGTLQVTSAGGAAGHVELDRRGVVIALERPGVWRLGGTLRESAAGFGGALDFAVASWRQAAEDLLGGELPVDGELSGRAELTLARGREPRVEGEIRTLALEVVGERATLAAPARFTVTGATVTLDGVRLVGPRSSLFVRGTRRADGRCWAPTRRLASRA